MINPAMTAPSGPRTTGPRGRLHATVARALSRFELVPFGLLAHQTADYYQPDNAECGTSLFDGSETENPCTVTAADLFAVTTLGIRLDPSASRRLLSRGLSVALIEQFLCPRVLPVDRTLAEHRKRSLGLAGAGEQVRDDLVEGLAAALIEARAGDAADVRSIALVGNASRLSGLAAALERAVAIPVRLGSLPESAEHALPPDVVRAASPDWGLAYGLALWEGDGV